ncbi:apolipoprotein N-acyltransferase [Legionella birminghamensis]|uniref:Apolipoprotein N-acyltransferase n=1 Tax=Legionella birminghamensis TaxID=28083 RepID=A0A378IB70_9GAMM|nr:apolipoprotein N-acyltransferase [Legionella birminghamensis]KTC75248.1 apolipoprotein N-acyltransferase [Legionella birminghamensis]STX31801.1 apolipoprotein N-acyltransferase [Legionella birminghamensis]
MTWKHYLQFLIYGLLLPLGFAPFHIPGMAILGIALFYHGLCVHSKGSSFLRGLFFGLGFFGLGVSWIYVSINEYGHLNPLISAFITLLFTLYLSSFPALAALAFTYLSPRRPGLAAGFLFSSLWVIGEFLRATLLSGFPWLLLGFGQFDAPVKYILPVLGVYGASFLTVFAATVLVNAFWSDRRKQFLQLALFVFIILAPLALKPIQWVEIGKTPVSIGVIQANLSMRDKWDESLFWRLLDRYQQDIISLLGTQLIVMPESAIPLPSSYISDFLEDLREKAKKAGTGILLGIPEPITLDADVYFNALISLGEAKGFYLKQHLVPFGEYIPGVFQPLMNWLQIPDANLKAGKDSQSLIKVHKHPVATLICYELAYGELLRKQFPRAEWIVSISDDGWFGHSLAMYQQQQIAQVRSLQTGRYQVVSNNDGLSSVINTRGDIIASLPAFNAGLLKASIFPASGSTPWVLFGDWPILILSFCIFLWALIKGFPKKQHQ